MSHTRNMIRRRGTDLYSSGSSEPRWVKESLGKVWRTMGHVRAHLSQFSDDSIYKGEAEIVAVIVSPELYRGTGGKQ